MKAVLSDVMWLTGLVEGDGCFTLSESRPVISVSMTDEDVVARVAKIWTTSYSKEIARRYGWLPTYRVSISGKKAIAWMKIMLPYLGIRRSSRVEEICEYFENRREERLLTNPNAETFAFQRFDRDILLREYETSFYRKLGRKYGVSYETLRRIMLDLDKRSRPRNGKDPTPPLEHMVEVHKDVMSLDAAKHWLAGLLEAEGSFMKGSPSRPGCPVVSLQMTDEDVVEKAKQIVQSNRKVFCCFRSKKNAAHKDAFVWQERGKAAFELMVKLRPLMGVRRQSQIDAAMACYTPDGQRVAAQKRANLKRTMSDAQVLEMWEFYQKGDSLRSMARQFGVHHETLRYAIKKLVPRILAAQVATTSIPLAVHAAANVGTAVP